MIAETWHVLELFTPRLRFDADTYYSERDHTLGFSFTPEEEQTYNNQRVDAVQRYEHEENGLQALHHDRHQRWKREFMQNLIQDDHNRAKHQAQISFTHESTVLHRILEEEHFSFANRLDRLVSRATARNTPIDQFIHCFIVYKGDDTERVEHTSFAASRPAAFPGIGAHRQSKTSQAYQPGEQEYVIPTPCTY